MRFIGLITTVALLLMIMTIKTVQPAKTCCPCGATGNSSIVYNPMLPPDKKKKRSCGCKCHK